MYSLCKSCHRYNIHSRFFRPTAWNAYLVHMRRGGYASDLKDSVLREEVKACEKAIAAGEPFKLKELRPYTKEAGKEWFANLRMDEASRTDPAARPRQPEPDQKPLKEKRMVRWSDPHPASAYPY